MPPYGGREEQLLQVVLMLLALVHTHKLNKQNNSLPKPQLQDRRHVSFFLTISIFFPNTSLPTHSPLLLQGVCWKTEGYGPRSCTSCSLQVCFSDQSCSALPWPPELWKYKATLTRSFPMQFLKDQTDTKQKALQAQQQRASDCPFQVAGLQKLLW